MSFTVPTVNFRIDDDLLEDVEDAVEESLVYENRSHFLRTAIRRQLEVDTDEFSEAR